MRDQVSSLLQTQAVIALDVEDARSGDHFFQCVLLPITPTDSLSKLRKACETVWGRIAKPFFPHLSLMYGDFSLDDKESIAQEVNAEQDIPRRLLASEVWLVSCAGAVEGWSVVEKWGLKTA